MTVRKRTGPISKGEMDTMWRKSEAEYRDRTCQGMVRGSGDSLRSLRGLGL
jgi:hypothetical protein